jgi:hypothetical protein
MDADPGGRGCGGQRLARKWVGRYRDEGELSGAGSNRPRRRSIPHRTSEQRVHVARRSGSCASRARDGRDVGHGSTLAEILTRIGIGKARGPAPWSRRSLMSASRMVSCTTSTARGSCNRGGAGHRISGKRCDTGKRADTLGVPSPAGWLGMRAERSTTAPGWPTPQFIGAPPSLTADSRTTTHQRKHSALACKPERASHERTNLPGTYS